MVVAAFGILRFILRWCPLAFHWGSVGEYHLHSQQWSWARYSTWWSSTVNYVSFVDAQSFIEEPTRARIIIQSSHPTFRIIRVRIHIRTATAMSASGRKTDTAAICCGAFVWPAISAAHSPIEGMVSTKPWRHLLGRTWRGKWLLTSVICEPEWLLRDKTRSVRYTPETLWRVLYCGGHNSR